MTDETATATFSGPANLIAHIEGLQATLTKRNARVAELEEKLDLAENGEPTQEALKRAYKRGWQACGARFGDVAREASGLLEQVKAIGRKGHIDAYDESEGL